MTAGRDEVQTPVPETVPTPATVGDGDQGVDRHEGPGVRGGRSRRIPPYLWPLSLAPVIGAWLVIQDSTEYLPPLQDVVVRTWEVLRQPETYAHLGATVRRLIGGLGLGYLSACLVTLIMRSSDWWRRFFMTYVFLTLSLPSLAVALFTLMIFGLSEVGVYIATAVIVFPFVVLSLQEGFDSLDNTRMEMAAVYRFSTWMRLRHVAIPETTPFLFAAFRNAHSLAWKIVIVAEVFSQSTGIGYQYKRAFDFFLLEQMVVWLLFFIAAVFMLEYLILRPTERWALRWRESH